MKRTPAPRSGRWPSANAGIVVAMLVMVAALSGLNHLARRVSPEAHVAYSDRLRELRSLNALIDRELVSARLGITRHYDELTRHTQQIEQVAALTLPLPALVSDADGEELARTARVLADSVQRKAELVDEFRRSNAVLLNSQSYFVTVTHQLLDAPDRPQLTPQASASVSRYARQVLTATAAAAPAARSAALPQVPAGSPPAVADAMADIRRHGEVIAARAQQVDALLQEVGRLQTEQLVDRLGSQYSQAHARAAARAARFQLVMYGIGVMLVAAVGWLFVRLRSAHRSLQNAHREVSERFAAQQAAEKQLVLHATAFRSAHDGITLTDAEGNILDVNPAFSRITGWSRDEVIGRNPRVLKSGYHDDDFYRAMWASIRGSGQWSGEIWNRNKQGSIYPELLSISAVKDEGGAITNFVAVFADIGHLKQQERQLTQLAYYDPLTELPNRKLLAERLASGMAQAHHSGRLLAVCLLDLDGFKPINDTWGHDAGDRVLVETAKRLQGALRSGDTVARLGGDEFALLLAGLASESECLEVVQRLIQVVAAPLGMLPEPVAVTASIGVTLCPHDDAGADTLLRHADHAMYQAKQAGKNCWRLFDAAQERDVRNQFHHLARLHEALQRGELQLHYQPKVDMRRGVVVGAEALLRWHDPTRGLLLPAQFLPQLGHDDLVEDIGDWVIEAALVQLEAWAAAGQRLPLSVNIAGRHLQAADFSTRLRDALQRHPAASGLLELEVLETSALEDMARTARVIDECRAMGVKFALDDFGAGYSSLSYLKRLPIEVIKIDLGFVRDLLTDVDDLIIVRGVIELGRAFGRQVVAEGVETAAHGRMLLQLQCDLAQGWAIAPAMPAGQWMEWLRDWRPDPAWARVRDLRWHEADLQLTMAEIRLRHWVDRVVHAIRDRRPVPHEHFNDPARCCFGAWYAQEGRQRYGQHPLYAPLDQAHRRLHAVVDAMDAQWRAGRFDEMSASIEALLAARDTALELLLDLQCAVAEARSDPSARPGSLTVLHCDHAPAG